MGELFMFYEEDNISKYYKNLEREKIIIKDSIENNIVYYKINNLMGSGDFIRIKYKKGFESILFKNVDMAKNVFNYNFFKNGKNMLEFTYCMEGYFELGIEGFDNSSRIGKDEYCIFYMPEKYKKFKMKYNNFSCFSIAMDFELLKNNINTPFNDEIIEGMITNSYKNYVDNFLLIEQSDKSLKDMVNDIYNNSIFNFSKLEEDILKIFFSIQNNKKFYESSIMTGIISVLLKNLDDPPYINDLSQKFNLSNYKIQKYFKESTGGTFYDFIKKQRVEKSKDLLKNKNLTIAYIASEIGYDNASKFSNMFKKEMNITPKKYRECIK
jgi:AraC-like DNA-binding protein